MLVTLVSYMALVSSLLWSLVGPVSILALLAHVEPDGFPQVSCCVTAHGWLVHSSHI